MVSQIHRTALTAILLSRPHGSLQSASQQPSRIMRRSEIRSCSSTAENRPKSKHTLSCKRRC